MSRHGPLKPAEEPLSIDVSYDRTRLAQNEIVRATVRNYLATAANMVMADLWIPPGHLLSEDLQGYVEKGAEPRAGGWRGIVCRPRRPPYFDSIAPDGELGHQPFLSTVCLPNGVSFALIAKAEGRLPTGARRNRISGRRGRDTFAAVRTARRRPRWQR